MTEYELATVALEEMTLRVAVGQLVVGLVIGLGKIAVVGYGIRALERDGMRRAREQDQRHTEAMTDLHELIARTTRTGGSA